MKTMETDMKKLIKGIAAASLLTFATGGFAAAQTAFPIMDKAFACNNGYAQCLRDGNNLSLAPTPVAGAEQVRMNFEHSTQCAAALQACYASN